jgi:H+/Cl- antiporter ClcA
MWEKLKKHQDTVGFISAVVVLLGGLILLIINPQSVEFLDIFFIIYPGLLFTLAGYYISCIRKITLVENEILQTPPLLKYPLFTCLVYQLW